VPPKSGSDFSGDAIFNHQMFSLELIVAQALSLRFVLDKASEKLAADHEAVVALAQVASKIRVVHAGPGGRRSNHPQVLVPTWTSSGNHRGHAPHDGRRGARSVCLGRLTIGNLGNIYSTIYRSSGGGATLIRGQQTGSAQSSLPLAKSSENP
jgi:hypothetical protein